MTARFEVPGVEPIEIEHLLLDVNGTLTNRGQLIAGVNNRLDQLANRLEIELLTADTFGTLESLAAQLGVEGRRVETGAEKAALVAELGAERCAAIGNGRNDAAMLAAVRLGCCVLGPEGASREAIDAADLVCPTIEVALDMLLEPKVLAATLRV